MNHTVSSAWKSSPKTEKRQTGLDQDCPRLEIPRTVKDHNCGPVFGLSQFRKFKD